MPVWAVTGKLGAGKTLVAVSRIQKYLNEGRRIATNLDLNVEHLVNPWAKNTDIVRVPDVPSADDLINLGRGYEGQLVGDEKNGLLVLDECAKWLNAREWNNPERKKLINHFVHLRKKRWDLILIIQDIEALDKQFRDLYCEQIVYCSRTDRYGIPLIGPILKAIWGEKVPLPKVHIGNVYYNLGIGKQSHIENWIYRGTNLYNAYDTEQGFNEFESVGAYTYLTPNHVYGRYITKHEHFKKIFNPWKVRYFFLIGAVIGSLFMQTFDVTGDSPKKGVFSCNDDWKLLFGDCSLTVTQVQQIFKSHQDSDSTSEDSGTALPVSEVSAVDHVLTGVYISGSVKYDNGTFEYIFGKDDDTFRPYEYGYKVYDVTSCKAVLVNLSDYDDRKELFCSS